MTLELLKNHIFGVKISRFCHLLHIIMDVIMTNFKICKPLVVYRFYCMAWLSVQFSCTPDKNISDFTLG